MRWRVLFSDSRWRRNWGGTAIVSARALSTLCCKGLEREATLRSTELRNGRSMRKVYRATPLGRKALKAVKIKVGELFGEINEK